MPRSFDSELVCVQNPTSRPSPPNRSPPPNPNSSRLRWSRATPPRSTQTPTRCSPPTCTTLPRPVFKTSAPGVGPHRRATPEDRISGEEARVAVGPRVAHADVIVQRAAHVETARAVAGDAPRVADSRCETSLHETVNQHVVAGVAVGGYRVPKETQQL